jgi:hypothetical protein
VSPSVSNRAQTAIHTGPAYITSLCIGVVDSCPGWPGGWSSQHTYDDCVSHEHDSQTGSQAGADVDRKVSKPWRRSRFARDSCLRSWSVMLSVRWPFGFPHRATRAGMIRPDLDEETPMRITLFKPLSAVRGLLPIRVTDRARSKESCKHACKQPRKASQSVSRPRLETGMGESVGA